MGEKFGKDKSFGGHTFFICVKMYQVNFLKLLEEAEALRYKPEGHGFDSR
jgi:hypothetical protein